MKCIQTMIEHMEDTLKEANEYYRDYIYYKDDAPKVANVCLDMAKVHMDLYNRLHNVVVSVINDYKQSQGDIPATMKELWNYKHTKVVDEYDELKYKINNV